MASKLCGRLATGRILDVDLGGAYCRLAALSGGGCIPPVRSGLYPHEDNTDWPLALAGGTRRLAVVSKHRISCIWPPLCGRALLARAPEQPCPLPGSHFLAPTSWLPLPRPLYRTRRGPALPVARSRGNSVQEQAGQHGQHGEASELASGDEPAARDVEVPQRAQSRSCVKWRALSQNRSSGYALAREAVCCSLPSIRAEATRSPTLCMPKPVLWKRSKERNVGQLAGACWGETSGGPGAERATDCATAMGNEAGNQIPAR
jgi:hypothetical protein